MQFVFPLFLFSLFLLAVPIIIHLFNFKKYKKIFFSNTFFFEKIKEDNKTNNKLKNLLILLCRLLALFFLIIAFAQPFIPNKGNGNNAGKNIISIYIDNSYSMEAVNKNGNLLELAKVKANQIVDAYKEVDKFQLLTNELKGEQQRLLSKEEIKVKISEVKITGQPQYLSTIIAKQKSALAYEFGNKFLFEISDFQKNTIQENNLALDTNYNWNMIFLKNDNVNNVFVDTAYFESNTHRLGDTEKLIVKIKNTSNNSINNLQLFLNANNSQIAQSNCNIKENGSANLVLTFNNKNIGWQNLTISLKDFPITFDNNLFLSYLVSQNEKILIINESENNYPAQAYKLDSYFNVSTFEKNNIDYSFIKNADVIFLNELSNISSGLATEIINACEKECVVIIQPNKIIDNVSYNNLLNKLNAGNLGLLDTNSSNIIKPNKDNFIFKGIFASNNIAQNTSWPMVSNHYKYSTPLNSKQTVLLQLGNGDIVLNNSSYKKGNVFVFSSTNYYSKNALTQHALYLPILYQIAFAKVNKNDLYYLLGKSNNIQIDTIIAGENNFKINFNEKIEVIPEQEKKESYTLLKLNNDFFYAGHANILLNNKVIKPIALNNMNTESVLSYYTETEFKNLIKKENKFNNVNTFNLDTNPVDIAEISYGKKLWKYFICGALIFLVLEVLITVFYKKNKL